MAALEKLTGETGYGLVYDLSRRSVATGVYNWVKAHSQIRRAILSRLPPFDEETLRNEMLPHGSGIDGNWNIEDEGTVWRAHNDFHVMNEWGYYDGYQGFTVLIPKGDPLEFEVIWDDPEAAGEPGLDEYVNDTIRASLDSFYRPDSYHH